MRDPGLGTKHKYAGDTVNIKYAGGFEYDASNVLKRIATSEGQLVPSGDTLRFDYFLKDHLGNVRVVWDESGKVIQSTDYYPFGLEIDRNQPIVGLNARNGLNRYLYNGKELQVGTGYVEYGARMYMPEIGRWGVVDPMAEKYSNLSPYAYVANNPLKYIDPDGKDIILVVSRDKNGNADLALRYQNNKFYNQDGSVYKQSSITGLSNRVLGALNNIRKSDSYLEKIISTLESTKSADHIIEFTHNVQGSKVKGNPNDVNPKSSLMLLDSDNLFKPLNSGEDKNLESTIAHELSHQYDRETGRKNRNISIDDKGTERDPNEIRAVNVENRYRVNNNMELRTHYGGKIDRRKLEDPKKRKQNESN